MAVSWGIKNVYGRERQKLTDLGWSCQVRIGCGVGSGVKLPRLLVTAIVATAVVPASAVADIAPPGNSAVDQYRESAPSTTSNSKKLSAERRRELAKKGEDGEALAAALDRNGGVPDGRNETGTTSGDGDASAAPSGATGNGRETGRGGDDAGATSEAPSSEQGESGGVAGEGTSSSQDSEPESGASESDGSTTTAAASATVGPLPVWTLLVGAVLIIGVGFVLRRRVV